jgi:hypothetical protein
MHESPSVSVFFVLVIQHREEHPCIHSDSSIVKNNRNILRIARDTINKIAKKTNQHSMSGGFPNFRFSLVNIPAFPFPSKYLMGNLLENGKARIFTSFAIE